MRNYLVVGAVSGVLVLGTSLPAVAQSTVLEETIAASEAGAHPRSYVDDPNDFMDYRTTDSTSNCGGNTACDITSSSFVVSKSSPDSVVVLAGMAGRTDAEMSNSEEGGLYLFVDSDNDSSVWEYVLWTRYQSYPLMQVVSSWVYSWDGDSWERTEVVGAWLRLRPPGARPSPTRSWG